MLAIQYEPEKSYYDDAHVTIRREYISPNENQIRKIQNEEYQDVKIARV